MKEDAAIEGLQEVKNIHSYQPKLFKDDKNVDGDRNYEVKDGKDKDRTKGVLG